MATAPTLARRALDTRAVHEWRAGLMSAPGLSTAERDALARVGEHSAVSTMSGFERVMVDARTYLDFWSIAREGN